MDFKGIRDQSILIKEARQAARILLESEGDQYLLSDFSGVTVGNEYMRIIKELGKQVLKKVPLTTAVVGISGLKQLLIQGYIQVTGSKLRTFRTVEAAMEYLYEKSTLIASID